jgi:hypothetical protein
MAAAAQAMSVLAAASTMYVAALRDLSSETVIFNRCKIFPSSGMCLENRMDVPIFGLWVFVFTAAICRIPIHFKYSIKNFKSQTKNNVFNVYL